MLVPLTQEEASGILVTEIVTHAENRSEQAALAAFISTQTASWSTLMRLSQGDFRAQCSRWIKAFKRVGHPKRAA
jgi:hypothetical protein